MINFFLYKRLPKKTLNRRLLISWVRKSHFYGVMAIIRSLYCTKKLTGKFFPIQCLVYPKMKFHLKVDKKNTIKLQGKLHIELWLAPSGSSCLTIKKDACFIVKNDFRLGENVQLIIEKSGSLVFGGKENSSGSGISSDTKVLVAEHVEIGEDSIIASNCFITDSNWHEIEGVIKTKAVHIGKHVWLSHSVSILKGARVADNSIVAAKSLVSNENNTPGVLLAGCPAITIKENVIWSR